MNGVEFDPDQNTAYYLGGPQPGQKLLLVFSPEELETTGIDYVTEKHLLKRKAALHI